MESNEILISIIVTSLVSSITAQSLNAACSLEVVSLAVDVPPFDVAGGAFTEALLALTAQ